MTSIKLVGSPVGIKVDSLSSTNQPHQPIPPTTAGNTYLLFVAVNQGGAATGGLTGISDSAGNTWTKRGTTSQSGTGNGQVATEIWAATGSTVSASWVRLLNSSASALQTTSAVFLEVTGLLSSPVDATNGGTNSSATSVTASNTPTVAGDIVLFFGANAATGLVALNHVADASQNLATVTGEIPAEGAGSFCNLSAIIGAPATALTTLWQTPAGATGWAWSTISLKATSPSSGPLYTVNAGDPVSAQDVNQIITTLQGSGTGQINVANRIQASLAGATSQSGFVGGTTSGPPTSGSFLLGDWVIDQTGLIWICTTAGSPGTWTRVGVGGYLARAYQATVQNFTAPISDPTAVLLDTPSFDPRSMWSAGAGGFVIPSGFASTTRWHVIAGQQLSLSTNGRVHVSITKNGTETSRGYTGPSTNNLAGGMVSDVVTAGATDTIRAAFYSTVTGSTVSGSANNFLCIALADA